MPEHMSLPATIQNNKILEIIAATDQCVMCGLCLPHCPTYNAARSEAESPRGRIALVRALYEEQLEINETISSHLDNCLTCLKCEQVCPANVDYEKIIDAGRVISHQQQSFISSLQKSLLLYTLSKASARKIVKTIIPAIRTLGLHRLFSKVRLFGLLPESSDTRFNFQNNHPNQAPNKPTVMIINSCAGDLVNDQTYDAARSILLKLGCELLEDHQTQCCGALHQHSGNAKAAHELREKFISSFKKHKPDHLVSLATGCGAQIKRYPILDNTPASQELASKLVDINEFVLQHIKSNKLAFKPLAQKVYLHKPCSQQQITEDTTLIEQLLKFIPDLEVVGFEDQLACCGAGGINTLSQNKLAQQLIGSKVRELSNASANYLVSSNIGCALHFQAKLRSDNIPTQVCHPVTLLAQQMIE